MKPLDFIVNNRTKNSNKKDSSLTHAHLNNGDAVQPCSFQKWCQQEHCLSLSLHMEIQDYLTNYKKKINHF